MKPLPANPEAYERWAGRLSKPSPIHRIPSMMVLECKCLVIAYHGNFLKAAWSIFSRGVQNAVAGWYWHGVYRVADMFWTTLRPVPDADWKIRHSRKCDRLNCQDIDCIKRALPRWFVRITGMSNYE